MRNKWTLLIFLCTIHVVYTIVRALLGLLAVPIQSSTGVDNVEFGILNAAIFWTYSAVVPVAGFVGDRFNRVHVIGWAAVLWSVMAVLTGFGNGFWSLLLLASVAVVIPQTAFGPTTCALLSDCHHETRTIALSCHQAAYYTGWFVSGVAVTLVLSAFGSWRAAFFVFGGLGILLGALFLVIFGGCGEHALPSQGRVSMWAGFAAVFRSPSACLLAIGYVADIFVLFGYSSWGPKFVAEKFAISVTRAGTGVMFWHYAASLTAVVLAGFATDRLVVRWPRFRIVLGSLAMALSIPALVGFGLARTLLGTWACAASLGVMLGLFGANMVAAVFDVIPSQCRAGVVGVLNVVAGLIGSLAPVFLGYLSQCQGTAGFEVGFAAMGVVPLLAAGAYATALTTFRKDHDRLCR